MRLKKIIKLFESGSVSISGLRGTGKDLLMSNVIARRTSPYISLFDYKSKNIHIPLDFNRLDVNNNFNNFITHNINYYDYEYPLNCDIYISDCGIIFPSQYDSALDKKYPNLPTFFALSRQIAHCNVHYNSQSLERVWKKLREQSDIYIKCNSCIYIPLTKLKIFKYDLVFQKITLYSKYQSCVDNVPPFPLSKHLFDKNLSKTNLDIAKTNYLISFGEVKRKRLLYFNKSNYDTYYFKNLLNNSIND